MSITLVCMPVNFNGIDVDPVVLRKKVLDQSQTKKIFDSSQENQDFVFP